MGKRASRSGAAAQQVLATLIERHAMLRTTFAEWDGQLQQRVAPASQVTLPVTSLQELPASAREAQARRVSAHEARQPFDIAQGPLFRTRLLRLQADAHLLVLVWHRLIADAWSENVLWGELFTLYATYAAGKPLALPELSMQFVDYAHWQRQWLQGAACTAQLRYWQQQLRNQPPVLQLPLDRPRAMLPTYQGAHHAFTLPAALCTALKTLGDRQGVTLSTTILSGWQILLQRYSGQDDISVGFPTNGRHLPGTERVIGGFANTWVLRTDLTGDPTFYELLSRVGEVLQGAYRHQESHLSTCYNTGSRRRTQAVRYRFRSCSRGGWRALRP
jgi:hypothetical protein